ncbi:MAG: glycosyltransferase, partial [Anaerolineales bacterium]|nr:glycosyltransferase [Anaerolineales bacterium]
MSQRTSPLRLLLLTPGYPPLPGGGERYVRELAQELARRGVRVTAVSTHARAEPDFWRGAPAPLAHETDADTRGGAVTLVRCPVRPFPGGRPGLLAWRKLMVL